MVTWASFRPGAAEQGLTDACVASATWVVCPPPSTLQFSGPAPMATASWGRGWRELLEAGFRILLPEWDRDRNER